MVLNNNVGTAIETITVSPLNHAPTLQVENIPAAATATLNGNTVGAIAVNYGGSDYVYPPAVTITGGGGSGATATAVLGTGASAGMVTGIDFTDGAGYTSDTERSRSPHRTPSQRRRRPSPAVRSMGSWSTAAAPAI